MALYLGSSDKLKIVLNGVTCCLNLLSATPIANVIRLLSSDGYILKSSNELYLVAKEDE